MRIILTSALLASALLVLAAFAGCGTDSTVEPEPQPRDTTAPVAEIAPLAPSQTSLLFLIDGEVTDEGSGVAFIDLQVQQPDSAWVEVGRHAGFPVSYQATRSGHHAFRAVATDSAGNRQDPAQAVVRVTEVPEPIIIVDLTGEEFDITNAVLRYNIAVSGFDHGLGRNTIRPIIDPQFIDPGQPGYPEPENLADIMAVDFGGQQRAYPIGVLPNREVVNDEVAGVHLAATY